MDGSAFGVSDRGADPDIAAIGHAGALLTIDLMAVRENYRTVRKQLSGAEAAAVVKADGYGLGAARIVRALMQEGCGQFFVAHLEEAIALRQAVPEVGRIIVLHGPTPGAEAVFHAHGIVPVLNSAEQVSGWAGMARALGEQLPALLQFDTGMSRFGLSEDDLGDLLARPDGLAGIDLLYVMSHLACADAPDHPANAQQLACFQRMRAHFPNVKASLSASSGVFLGPDYHFDLVRPGAALYGVNPQPGQPNPLQPVVRLQGAVMQVRTVGPGASIGYGHTITAERPMQLATVAVGYADGFLRSTGSNGAAWLGDTRLPVVGRVSMDSIILDATDVPLAAGTLVDLIGPRQGLDDVARAAGTIGYEILTSLGSRFARRFIGG